MARSKVDSGVQDTRRILMSRSFGSERFLYKCRARIGEGLAGEGAWNPVTLRREEEPDRRVVACRTAITICMQYE